MTIVRLTAEVDDQSFLQCADTSTGVTSDHVGGEDASQEDEWSKTLCNELQQPGSCVNSVITATSHCVPYDILVLLHVAGINIPQIVKFTTFYRAPFQQLWTRIAERDRRLLRGASKPCKAQFPLRDARNATTHTHGKYLAIICKYDSCPVTKKGTDALTESKHRFWIKHIFRERIKQESVFNLFLEMYTTTTTRRFIITSAWALLSLIFCICLNSVVLKFLQSAVVLQTQKLCKCVNSSPFLYHVTNSSDAIGTHE